uniref:Uncharacterized protein n=2 Tax=Solanum tuberosum TaxID=4113 RepID=M1CG29_SOLTU
MEEAIDDWLLRQMHWLRREDVIAQGIKWIQDIHKEIIHCSAMGESVKRGWYDHHKRGQPSWRFKLAVEEEEKNEHKK